MTHKVFSRGDLGLIEAWNYETPIRPVKGKFVHGFRFYRDTHGKVIVRCKRCQIGYATNLKNLKERLSDHRARYHGGRRPITELQKAQEES